jgi:hypothetical protein
VKMPEPAVTDRACGPFAEGVQYERLLSLDVPGNLKHLRQELHPGECATHKALADAIAEEP